MLFDTHVHMVQFLPEERERQIETAKGLGTRIFIEVATTAENAPQVVQLAEARDDFYCGVAVHPWQVETYAPSDVAVFKDIIRNSNKVVCIGECGLDYSRGPSKQVIEQQQQLFRTMIRLAREFGLPLNMHSDRLSSGDLLRILREERAYEVGGMMHNFQGNLNLAQQYLDMGFYISVCVLIHHPLADRLRGAFREVSIGQMVMDSDAPGAKMVPVGNQEQHFPYDMDKLSEPRMLRYIADKVAEVKGMAVEDVEAITSLNARRLFGLLRVV